jgi:hypothetical protein
LLFSGPGQEPRAAATAAAAWAQANWRPSAIQRKVRPGVVVIHVAPKPELTQAGMVSGTAVPAAVWTVDSETGKVEVAGSPPGSPSSAEVKHAAAALIRGIPAPSLGELDAAERALLQTRTISSPQVLSGVVSICLILFALRYGFGALMSTMAALSGVFGARSGTGASSALLYTRLLVNVLILGGIILGLGVVFNVRNLAFRTPGFSSSVSRTRTLTWVGYVSAMIALAVVLDVVLPAAEQPAMRNAALGEYTHVSVAADSDGSETFVAIGGDLKVDLSAWPKSEWSGIQFKSSNPSVLTLDAQPSAGGPPVALFSAHQAGTCRVDAASADGRYTFQLRVTAG